MEDPLEPLIEVTISASGGNIEMSQRFKWDKSSTLLLIDKYSERKDDFRDPRKRKKDLWTSIRGDLKKHGYEINENSLDKKWRNLKKTYMNLKDNIKKTGRGRVFWEHYEAFQCIYAQDKTINLPTTISEGAVPYTPPVSGSGAACSVIVEKKKGTVIKQCQASTSRLCESTPTFSQQKTRDPKSGMFYVRKRAVEIEEKRVEEIKLLRLTLERSNKIQEERNEILQHLINKK